MGDEAFVTLSTNDNYCLGAMVLGYSLRNVGTTKQLVVLVTPSVSQDMRKCLAKAYDLVQEVDVMHSKEQKILEVMKRPELSVTLTKLHCWRLTQFKKCIFMDADTLPLKNIDELFEKEELSAVCDIGWPDCFNTGLFVFRPSETTFAKLCALASECGSFDGGDQGLLNTYFSDWATSDISKHLSFIYNMSSVATYSYPAAYARFGDKVKVVHFLGSLKPWMYGFNAMSKKIVPPPLGSQTQQLEHVQNWWDVFIRQVQPNLTADCAAEFTKFEQEYRDGVDDPSKLSLETWQDLHEDINNNQALEMSDKEQTDEVDEIELDLQQDNSSTIHGSNDDDDRLKNDETNSSQQQAMENIITPSDETEINDNNDPSIVVPSSQDASKRKKAWEKGSMDYLGIDRFDNIQRKLDQAIGHLKSLEPLGKHEPEARPSSCYIESKKYSGTCSLDISMGLASQLAKLRLDSPEASLYPGAMGGGAFFDDYSRKRAWETGAIDYMGADSFDNIRKKLDQAIGKPQFVLEEQEESANGQTSDQPKEEASTVEATPETTTSPTEPTEAK